MFESIVVPVVLYGCGTWPHYKGIEKKLEVLEMMGLRMICGVSRREMLSNEIINERCGWKRGLVSRCQQGILKWYGHLIRM